MPLATPMLLFLATRHSGVTTPVPEVSSGDHLVLSSVVPENSSAKVQRQATNRLLLILGPQ